MLWKKQQSNKSDDQDNQIEWDDAAKQALEQAIQQAPVPALLRGKVKKELSKAAEQHAIAEGHTKVTPEDLMNGMLAKMPANMKTKVEEAMKKGPEGLAKLKDELK